jgi:hypothetical protein
MITLDRNAYLDIQLAGYPHGVKLKCHIRTEKNWEKEDFSNFVKENFKISDLDDEYKKFVLYDIFVRNIVYTNIKKVEEQYDVIIIDSILKTSIKKDNKKKEDAKKKEDTKEEKTNLKKVTTYNQTDDDIKWLIQTLNDELFMREHELSNDHFKFLIDNEEITLENVKGLFDECEGDIFKLRKRKIRDNIKELLN